MIGISHIPYHYDYLVAMVTKRYLNNFFVLSPNGFKFDRKVFYDNTHQPHILLPW